MNQMSINELNVSSNKLINHLRKGGSTSLVYKSKTIGIISPFITKQKKIIGKSFISFLNKIKPDEIVSKVDRKNIYKQHLIEKYG